MMTELWLTARFRPSPHWPEGGTLSCPLSWLLWHPDYAVGLCRYGRQVKVVPITHVFAGDREPVYQ